MRPRVEQADLTRRARFDRYARFLASQVDEAGVCAPEAQLVSQVRAEHFEQVVEGRRVAPQLVDRARERRGLFRLRRRAEELDVGEGLVEPAFVSVRAAGRALEVAPRVHEKLHAKLASPVVELSSAVQGLPEDLPEEGEHTSQQVQEPQHDQPLLPRQSTPPEIDTFGSGAEAPGGY
jgi:hypothetical protein